MSSNVKKLPKLPPLPRLRVKKPVLQQESSPCLVIMSNLLNCWSSNGDGSNLCKGLEVNLKQCMETTPKNQKAAKSSINYHAARLYPRINGKTNG